jgi:hypothetical protein
MDIDSYFTFDEESILPSVEKVYLSCFLVAILLFIIFIFGVLISDCIFSKNINQLETVGDIDESTILKTKKKKPKKVEF